ncbi:MAG: hypothetical protein ABWX74_17520 [Aeromicrobium sp.]
MGARQGDWELVGRDSDPVPGDPVSVLEESDHYADVAATIRSQAYRLRHMAESNDDLKGAFADGLKDGMKDLAEDLEKAYDRFDITSEQLAVLEPALSTARVKTMAALNQAIDDKNTEAKKADNDPDYEPPEKTPGEKSAAETACDTAMEAFDSVAQEVARKIKAAADDDMKDSGWDKFKNFVGSIATKLSFLADILGYIALALTVIAMFIPGLNVLVLVLALTLGSLLIHTLLAVTDNGDWIDVAFDVVGLLTLGIGSKALTVAKAGRAVTLTRAATTSARTAETAAFARTAWNGGQGFRGALSLLRPSVRTAMRTAYNDEFARVVGRQVATSTTVRSMLRAGGDREVANLMDDLARIRVDFPGVDVAINHAKGLKVAAGAAGTGLVADIVDKTKLADGAMSLVTGNQ